MKFNIKNRKLRYGSLTVAMTAFIIAVVVLVNVIFTSLAKKNLWYIDMTPEKLYTLTDVGRDFFGQTFDLVNKEREEKGEDPAEVEILFCDEPDALQANDTQRMVYNMALELEKTFPDTISVDWVDIVKNPSAVQGYGNPKTTSVIVKSGTEYRTLSLRNFFVFNEASDSTPWGYKMERTFAVNIAAIIQAEAPIALFTVNHGETLPDQSLMQLISDAGYKVGLADLSTGTVQMSDGTVYEKIPEDTRLIITYDPKSDFLVKDGVSEISEIEYLDKFLDKANAYMVFTDADTPVLPNLEEFLEEWGISYCRSTEEISASGETSEFNYMIKDTSQSLSTDGFTFIGEYNTKGYGGSVTSEMRAYGVPKKVIFKNASSIKPSGYFEKAHYHDEEAESGDTSTDFWYYSYYQNGVSRSFYDVFTSSAEAVAMAHGKNVAKADNLNKFNLFTLSREQRLQQDDNYNTQNNDSFVLACTSTEFATADFLQSAVYGNSDLLLSTLRTVGKEIVPVSLSISSFSDSTISSITTRQATQYTVALAVIPAVIMFVLGVVVIVRRRFS